MTLVENGLRTTLNVTSFRSKRCTCVAQTVCNRNALTSNCVVGGPSVVVSTAAFHARVRRSFPGLGGFKGTKMFLPHPPVKLSIVKSLCDREVACSASGLQGLNFESCVWREVSSHSSHHPQEVLLAQFSLYVHKSGLKLDSFHFIFKLCCVVVKDKIARSNPSSSRFMKFSERAGTFFELVQCDWAIIPGALPCRFARSNCRFSRVD